MRVELKQIELSSKSELLEFLRQFSPNETVLLGVDAKIEKKYYAYKVTDPSFPIRVIGLIDEGQGIVPECYCVEDILLVGFNCEICIVRDKAITRIAADSVFYTFLNVENADRIIAIFELDVVCFSIAGKKIWEYSAPDIITNWYIEAEYLVIETDCGEERIMLLATGTKHIVLHDKKAYG